MAALREGGTGGCGLFVEKLNLSGYPMIGQVIGCIPCGRSIRRGVWSGPNNHTRGALEEGQRLPDCLCAFQPAIPADEGLGDINLPHAARHEEDGPPSVKDSLFECRGRIARF